MSCLDAVTDLIGNGDSCNIDPRIEMRNNEELYHIAERIKSTYLMHHVIIKRMYVHCYLREYLCVADLAEKYRFENGINNGTKRTLDFMCVFF